MRRKLNRDQKRARTTSELATFVRQYARTARAHFDPNDRCYSCDVERIVKRIKPEELDRLLRDDEDDA